MRPLLFGIGFGAGAMIACLAISEGIMLMCEWREA
jgi:hypothetical protein